MTIARIREEIASLRPGVENLSGPALASMVAKTLELLDLLAREVSSATDPRLYDRDYR